MSNVNDKVYTPEYAVDEVMEIFHNQYTGGLVMEPFRGGGAFFNKLPEGSLWCEIDEGVDFLDFNGKVDWIITNPPYSIFDEMLDKMLQVADNIILVIPVNKILSSMPRLMSLQCTNHCINHIHYLGSGRQIGFPFGFPVGAVVITKRHSDIKITYSNRCKGNK